MKLETPQIFLSYRRADAMYAAQMLFERLRATFGDDAVFMDGCGIPLGVDFRMHINAALKTCRVMLALLGDTWLDVCDADGKRRLDNPDDDVRLELEKALARNIPIIPVLCSSARLPAPSRLAPSLAPLVTRNAIELRPDNNLRGQLDELVRSVRFHLIHSPPASSPPESRKSAPPQLTLTLESGPKIVGPRPADLERIRAEEFAILERADHTYIQCCRRNHNVDGRPQNYELEFQDGSLERHYYALEDPISFGQILSAFKRYLRGDDSWENDFTWKHLAV